MNYFENFRQQNPHLFGEDKVGSFVKSVKMVKKTVPDTSVLAVENLFVLLIMKN